MCRVSILYTLKLNLKLGIVAHVFNPGIDTGRALDRGQPDLHREFQANQSYTVSESLSQKKQ